MVHHYECHRSRSKRQAFWTLVLLMKSTTTGFSPASLPTTPSGPSTLCSGVGTCRSDPLYLMTSEEEEPSSSTKSNHNHHQGPLFHRAFSRILRNKTKRKQENNELHMLRTEELADGSSTSFATDFILQSFEQTAPSDVFPPTSLNGSPTKRRVLDFSEYQDAILMTPTSPNSPATPLTSGPKSTTKFKGGPLLNRMTRAWLQTSLKNAVHRLSTIPPIDLNVKVTPRAVMALLCKGQFRCDASIDARRVVFRNLRMTGGKLEAKKMTINLLNKKPRYSQPFDLHAHNFTFTQEDLFESNCVRNGLARLLVRILRNAGVTTSQIQVTAVDIVPSGKISCSGFADTVFGSKVSFEVRSGLSMSSRGHIVNFPGLEVSLGPALGVFMPVVPDIDLDIGHNARLHAVEVDGRRRRVTLSASATVTPAQSIKIPASYRQARDAYAAQFTYDVGRWVTNHFNFTR